MDRLGLGYEALAPAHPRLVYCSISGFGQTGPRRAEPGYDAVIQGEAGLMSITGAADGPPFRLGVAIADIVSGMFAAQGIAMALLARARTGRGQRVDIGMLDATAALLTYQAGIYFATGATPGRMGNRHPTIVPYETFPASDGEFVLAVGNDEQWRRCCAVIGAAALRRGRAVLDQPGAGAASRHLRAFAGREAANPAAGCLGGRSQARGSSLRFCPRSRRSAGGSASGGTRNDRNRRAHHRRRDEGARHTDQAVGHAGFSATGAARRLDSTPIKFCRTTSDCPAMRSRCCGRRTWSDSGRREPKGLSVRSEQRSRREET